MREHLHPAIASTRTTTRTSALSITDQIRRDRVHPSTSITTQSPRARGRPRAAYGGGVRDAVEVVVVGDVAVETGAVLVDHLQPAALDGGDRGRIRRVQVQY